jgi:hypothetical protein
VCLNRLGNQKIRGGEGTKLDCIEANEEEEETLNYDWYGEGCDTVISP